jgi:hypothetical protein
MDRKIFDRIKKFYENMTTEELLEIWVNNDQDTYPLRDFQAVKILLQMRNQTIPKQKEYIKNDKEEYTVEDIVKLTKGAVIFLFIFGAFNIVYWIFGCAEERNNLLGQFSDVKFLLSVRIYGQLAVSVLLVLAGIIFYFMKENRMVLLVSGFLLCFSGVWNLFSDLLTIPAFAQYNKEISIIKAFDNIKYILYAVSVLQIRWGFNQIRDFIKIKNSGV